ncbi:LPXTG cell wall anchor domain-containing protein [Catellatospora bangladeshensis]|uniref:Gram-positive cocci surface proteins LPxTG domain-containing protein n=1 Tax=Catellatospora bangladeshensis TaxID=310355 RepID=A0A8J3JHE7_9ACTN|nr:LPXTG cell wall anchor domain-containing protein [Catellatospora bangladeshensis]GIF80731.1 hypothetical protein Cba03nite_20800 [Catellatospora bangladeshensis]
MRPSAFLHTVLPLLAVAVLHSAAQAAAPGTSVAIDLGEPAVRSRTVAFGPTAAPQSFTVGCAPGEQLLSGGYGDADPEVRVLASHPTDDQGGPVAAGSQPRAWTVTVLGLRQSAGSLRVSALCLAGGEVTAAAFAGPPADGLPDPPPAECPSGTVRSGGGYATAWQARLGAAVVSGSHPVGERGWAVDAGLTRGQAALRASNWATAYAVCLTGPVQPVAVEDVSFNLDTLARECVPGIAAGVCLVPRLGVATAHCPPGALTSGGGFRAGDAAGQRQYSVAEDGPSAYATWTVRVSAYTTDAAPAPMRLTPVCLFPVAAPDAPVGDLLPDSGASRNQALTIVGLLALLLLALLAVLALRRGRRRPTPVGGIEVVVRTVRTRYRTDQYREDG